MRHLLRLLRNSFVLRSLIIFVVDERCHLLFSLLISLGHWGSNVNNSVAQLVALKSLKWFRGKPSFFSSGPELHANGSLLGGVSKTLKLPKLSNSIQRLTFGLGGFRLTFGLG